jgi:hypothetical protein
MQEEKPELAAIRKWNMFLEHMIAAKQAWQIFLEYRRNVRNFENLPRGAGKFLGLATSRSTFEVASQRLMDYARKYEGGFQGMIVKLEQPEQKEEVKDARQPRRERKS